VRHRCIGPEGDPGGLYVVGEHPTAADDAVGRPFNGVSARYIRSVVAKLWKGPVVYDSGLRCAPKDRDVTEKMATACRPYAAGVIAAVRPTRILALGGWAVEVLLGRKPPVATIRRGHGWWIDPDGAYVPVYIAVSPTYAARNRFINAHLMEDLEWALTAPAPVPRMLGATTWDVCTEDDADWAAEMLRRAGDVTFDTETSGVPHDRDFRVECLTLFARGTRDGYTWDRPALEDPATREPLIALLRDRAVWNSGHNLKYDTLAVWLDPLLAIDTRQSMRFDTRLGRKLLDGDVDARLDVASELVGMGGHKAEAAELVDGAKTDLARLSSEPHRAPLASGKPRKPYAPKVVRDVVPEHLEKIHAERAEPINYAYRYVPTAVRTRYNARDALATTLLLEDLEPRVMAAPNLKRTWEKVMLPAMRAFTRMEKDGVLADRRAIDMLDSHLTVKIDQIHARLVAVGGTEMNFDSTQQLQKLLFGKLGLKSVKETDSGAPSTSKEALEQIVDSHPIVRDLIDYSHLTTIRGTFARGMRGQIRDDGRLHTTYLIDGTGPGRPSSRNPNLNNIPSPDRDKELGKMCRDCFVAPPGYVLVEADQSQIELRVAADLSRDAVMTDVFRAGLDLHAATAEKVAPVMWGVQDWAALDPAMKKQYRRAAKSVNFQLLYDVEPAFKLGKTLGIPSRDAEKFVALIMGQYRGLAAWMKRLIAAGKRHGGVFCYIDGELANWRPLPALGETMFEGSRGRIKNAINAIINTPVQGSAAHYTTRSLEPVQQRFDREGIDGFLVGTVYDSITAQVREDQVAEAGGIMREVMTSWGAGDVPLVVDLKVGQQWGSMEEMH
jgi:uracil-DNA glycosylase family 4